MVQKSYKPEKESDTGCLKISIANFEKHFDKLKQNNIIDGAITHADTVICDDSIPTAVSTLYSDIYSIYIIKPRSFILFPLIVEDFHTKQWVKCADMGGHSVYFDTSHVNDAGEFDIVNLENNYVVTKTLASLLTNKVWAWIERNRKIWMEEI